MSLKKSNCNGGFVALITAIILTAILLVVTVTLNQTGFLTRGILLDSEYKERSSALAEACVDVARLKLANNSLYLGDEPEVLIGSEMCEIFHVDPPVADQQIIKTRAVYNKAVTNLEVTVDSTDFSVISWEEVPYF